MHEISKWMPGRYTNWKVILRASGVILRHLNLEGLCESYFLVKHWSIFVTLTPLCWDLHPRGCHNLSLTIFWFDPFKATKTTWIHFWPTVSVEKKSPKVSTLSLMCTVAALCPWSTWEILKTSCPLFCWIVGRKWVSTRFTFKLFQNCRIFKRYKLLPVQVTSC